MTKILFKAALAATALTGVLATPAMAANSDTKPFSATAVIVKPLTLTKVTDLDFGTITMGSGVTSSNVVVGRAGGGTTACGANLTCTAPTAASFDVLGVANQGLNVSVAMPANPGLLMSGTRSVAFAIDAPATISLDSLGDGSFEIGGTITVLAGTADGTYTNNVNVTVTYQ